MAHARGDPGLPDPTRNSTFWIFWVSAVGLYLELLLIRWIGTEIRVFAYLQNTVLVTCFLGLGVGLFTARRAIRLGRATGAILVLACAITLPAIGRLVRSTSELLSVLGDVNIWLAATTANMSDSPIIRVLRNSSPPAHRRLSSSKARAMAP